MTVIPTVDDYPDFTERSQFTSSAIISVTATATSTPTTVGTFYTGGYESLMVTTSNQGAGVGWVYTFKWFADQALTVQTGQLGLRTLSAIPINAQVPNRGPWCTVTVTTTSASAKSYTMTVVPRTGTPSGAGAFLDGLIQGGTSQPIAAGVTFTQNAFSLTTGEACLTVATGATTWWAKLYGLDETSATIGVFAGADSTSGVTQSARFILPPYWTQLQINNGDGVSRNFDFAVQAAL